MSAAAFTAGVPLLFVRHGATALNLAGLRCGGDLDVPLVAEGRAQIEQAAEQLHGRAPDVIVAADLLRTRQSASILAQAMPHATLLVTPAFRERRLGGWNGSPLADHEAALAAGHTPPGGESVQAFRDRVELALEALQPWFDRRLLLVGSKGVARMLGELLGAPARAPAGNGEIIEFELAAFAERCAA